MGSLLRKQDEKCADIVSDFLDENFYSKYARKFERIYNVKEQVIGIDTKFFIGKEPYTCDEKAAIRYANKHLGTFSMELAFIDRKGNLEEGWLTNVDKVNNSFLFVWLDKTNKDIIESTADIKRVEIALVKRSSIIEYLEQLGWTREKLMKKCQKIIEGEDENFGNIRVNGCKFSFSEKLYEKPVNVLIPREKLIEISDISEVIEK